MKRVRPAFAALPLLLALAACERSGDAASIDTRFPGQVSAQGGTSGQVMNPAVNASDPAAKAAGTPGIPEGSGGTTSGARLGGTTGGSSIGGSGEKTPTQASPAASAPQRSAAEEAERQKTLLDESMSRVAQRWRERAAKEGWTAHPPTPEGGIR